MERRNWNICWNDINITVCKKNYGKVTLIIKSKNTKITNSFSLDNEYMTQ